jgi:hypothetical protein
MNDEVIFQRAGIGAVETEVNARVDVVNHDAGVIRHILVPARGIVAREVVAGRGQLGHALDTGRRVAADEVETQNVGAGSILGILPGQGQGEGDGVAGQEEAKAGAA